MWSNRTKPPMAAIERHSCGLSLPRSLAGTLLTAAIAGADKADLLQCRFQMRRSNATLSQVGPRCDSVATASEPADVGSGRIKRCRSESRVQADRTPHH